MRRRLHVLVGLVVVAALWTTGCGGESDDSATGTTSASGGGLTGSLTVFAAASLTESLEDAKTRLIEQNPGLSITYSFAGSQQLVSQITAGAPADVVATADQQSMAKLVEAGLVDPPEVFARNKLQIVVASGNPKGIEGLSDLGGDDLKVVLAEPSVPVGKYTRQALDRAGVAVNPVSLELDVKSVLRRVTSGEADAGVVYVTDVAAAGSQVTGIDIPDDQNEVAAYPAAVVQDSGNPEAAQAYLDQLVSGTGQEALRSHGFLPA